MLDTYNISYCLIGSRLLWLVGAVESLLANSSLPNGQYLMLGGWLGTREVGKVGWGLLFRWVKAVLLG